MQTHNFRKKNATVVLFSQNNIWKVPGAKHDNLRIYKLLKYSALE